MNPKILPKEYGGEVPLADMIGEFFLPHGDLIFTLLQLQSVPLATEPGISLIILPLMKILQQNLKQTYLIV